MATDVTTQFVREAPEIEAQKLGLIQSSKSLVDAANQAALQGRYLTPSYQIAGFSPDQVKAMEAARTGIGAYQPYMSTALQQTGLGRQTLENALQAMGGSFPFMQEGAAGIRQGQTAAQRYTTADLAPSQAAQMKAAEQMLQTRPDLQAADAFTRAGVERGTEAARYAQIAANIGAAPQIQAAQMGPAERLSTTSFAQPGSAEAYMSPYMQNVVDRQQQAAQREADIQRQTLGAQFAQAGAFGGSRFGVQQARMAEALARQKGDIQAQGMQNAFQQAQQQFNTEQQARLAAQQANQQAGLTVGQQNLAAQQQANLANQQMMGQYGLQGAQLGLSAAQQQAQAGQMSLQAAQQLAAQEAQQTAARQAALQFYGNTAQNIGQQALQQSQLGQAGAALQGQLGGQLAGMAGLNQQLAQGIGSLGMQQAQLGSQYANLGAQQQALGQQDVNFLYNIGAQQQRQQQAILDAQRQNQLQQNMQPYQQMAFLSDIYKGAPSTQMAMTQQTQAAPSPFQQVTGLTIGGVSAAAAANKAGLF